MSSSTQQFSPEQIREFVIAGHGNFARVKEMLDESPALLNVAHEWAPGDTETAIQGAAHVGNRAIAEYLLEQGAPLEIWTAVMLNQKEAIAAMLSTDPESAHATSAHNIPLLPHAAFNGDVALFQMLVEYGTTDGMSQALSHAVGSGHVDLTKWIMENGNPDLTWTNFQGKTILEIAQEGKNSAIIELVE